MRLPDQKEVRKLVGYIRDGMNRAEGKIIGTRFQPQ